MGFSSDCIADKEFTGSLQNIGKKTAGINIAMFRKRN